MSSKNVHMNFRSLSNHANANKSSKHQLVQGANLRVERLRDKDAGTYTCRICNGNGNEPALGRARDIYEYKSGDEDASDVSVDDECDERSSLLKVLGKRQQQQQH